MKDKINTELQKLQEELSVLDSAAKQIQRAGEISETVVTSAKEVQGKYTEQLDKLLQLYSEYLNKTYRHTEESIKKLYEFFQEKIKDEENILEKYTELTIKTEDLTHEYLKKTVTENKNILDEITKNSVNQVEKQQQKLEEFYNQTHAKLTGYYTETESKLTEVLVSHNDKINKVDELLAGYLELAQSTASLTQVLENVDFPKRLDELNVSIQKNKESVEKINYIVSAINKLQTENSQKLQKIDADTTTANILKIVENQTKGLKSTKRLTLVILIFNIIAWGGLAFIFLYFFPDFFEALFSK